jgi:arylsulfatase A-like enzyme
LKETRKTIFFVNDNKTKFGVLSDGYKYIKSIGKTCLYNGQREELYNIKVDPDEEKNIINDKPELANKMKTMLTEYLRKYDISLSKDTESIDKEKTENY